MGIDILEHHQQACLLLVEKYVVLNTEILIVLTERSALQETLSGSKLMLFHIVYYFYSILNANYRKLPVNFRIIADSAAKLQKKSHYREDKTGKTVCQTFNLLSIKGNMLTCVGINVLKFDIN